MNNALSHDTPEVSVVMTAFNAERWLAEAIESTLGQTHASFEFLIVNDGSTDRTGEIIDAYARSDARIVPIHHENWGMGNSLNHAIDLARNEWIVRIDADDIMMPDRIERQLAFLAEHPEVSLSASLAFIVGENGTTRWATTTDLLTLDDYARYRDSGMNIPLLHPAVIMRKSIVQAVGGYRQEYWSCDDMDLWYRMVEHGAVTLVQPDHLLKYRVHHGSVSGAKTRDQIMKIRWVKRSMQCRRSALPEPTLGEFRAWERGQPLHSRLQRYWAETAEVLYRTGTVYRCSGQMPRAVFNVALSALLNPGYAKRKLKSKLVNIVKHRRLPGAQQTSA